MRAAGAGHRSAAATTAWAARLALPLPVLVVFVVSANSVFRTLLNWRERAMAGGLAGGVDGGAPAFARANLYFFPCCFASRRGLLAPQRAAAPRKQAGP